MFIEANDKPLAKHIGIAGRKLMLSFIAVAFVLSIYSSKAHAQIVGDLEVSIPFQFHAGDAKLPAGKYLVHMLDKSDRGVMEISSADGSTSALFEVGDAQANTAPAKSELIFNKYGTRYFLTKVFDESNPYGNSVVESRYEERVGQATAEAQAHVPAHHKGQQRS